MNNKNHINENSEENNKENSADNKENTIKELNNNSEDNIYENNENKKKDKIIANSYNDNIPLENKIINKNINKKKTKNKSLNNYSKNSKKNITQITPKKDNKKINNKSNGCDENSILVICAHSDDQIFGPGGTVAKYTKEGKKVHTIIFSYGEGSHPWFKKEHTIPTRVKEALDVDKFVGGDGVMFLGLEENKFMAQYKQKKIYPKLKRVILKYRPSRIFTHSVDDSLPDHRNVNKCVIDTVDKMKYSGEVYMFDVWTVFNLKKRDYANIIIDISDTFNTKIKALKLFKSQKVALFSLMWSVYLRAWLNGKKIKSKYAEVFYKIR